MKTDRIPEKKKKEKAAKWQGLPPEDEDHRYNVASQRGMHRMSAACTQKNDSDLAIA